MAVSVRRASLADLEALAPLFDAYRRFYGQPADLGRARDWLHARISQGESTVLIAERDGAAVGFVQLYPMFSSVRTARIWILNDLYVDTSTRRGGIGRALLGAAAAFARDDGAARLMLETGRDNAAARALYRAAGWSEDDSQWYSLDVGAAA
jgi:ribosomal protein S18 acetylase RimI-like enzyme